MKFFSVGQAGLELSTSDEPPTSAAQSAGITGMSHLAWPNFCIFRKDRVSSCSSQAGLELLTPGDLPTSASQSDGITGVSHHPQLTFCIFSRDRVSPC